MKFNFKGIRFNIWFYFALLSLSILVLIGLLQSILIKPYYRNNRIMDVTSLSSEIKRELILNENIDSYDIDYVFDEIINNDVCVMVLNQDGQKVYEKDALGASCIFNKPFEYYDNLYDPIHMPKEMRSFIKEEKPFKTTLKSSVTGLDMLLYGEEIKAGLGNYFLFINASLEPIDAFIDFIFSQFTWISIVVMSLCIFLAFVLSKKVIYPIVKIQKEAAKLKTNNYDLNLNVESYSEINDLAKTLSEATEQLSKVDELRRDLIANVSHDIKTPLTMIKAYSEMIKDISGDDKEKRNKHLEVIINETEYLDHLVDDMRELSSFEAGNLILNKENFELKVLINDVLKLYDAYIKKRHLKIEYIMDNPVIYADKVKLKQVISNFLSNAIKHTPDNGIITIVLSDKEDTVYFSIKDTGEGINQDDIKQIWDRYYKIDKRFTRDIHSTGLGLAIAKAILEAHHYCYGVRSKQGEGALFYFEIKKTYEEE